MLAHGAPWDIGSHRGAKSPVGTTHPARSTVRLRPRSREARAARPASGIASPRCGSNARDPSHPTVGTVGRHAAPLLGSDPARPTIPTVYRFLAAFFAVV